jgi:hypothetical protein
MDRERLQDLCAADKSKSASASANAKTDLVITMQYLLNIGRGVLVKLLGVTWPSIL